MKRAILTGFKPFGPYKYNPTQDIAREYNLKWVGDIEIIGLVLPCTYYGAFGLLSEKIDELKPDIVLSCGLASRVKRIRIETVGRNIMNGKYMDADGYKPNKVTIIRGDKPFYMTNTDHKSLKHALDKEGISSEISRNAERFICNSLIYLTAQQIRDENLPINFAFFHTPWTTDYLDKILLEPEKTAITKDELRKTIEIMIKEMGRQ